MLFLASTTWLAVSVWVPEHPALVALGLACAVQAPVKRRRRALSA